MTYLYKDPVTGHIIERSCPLTDTAPVTVEHDGRTFHRHFTAPAIIYAVMGFYCTDNLDPIERWRKENLGKGD